MGRPKGSKDLAPRKRYASCVVLSVVCSKCGAGFETRRKKKTYRCKPCISVAAVERKRLGKYHERPDYKNKARNWRLKSYYNMTPKQYESLNVKQNGKCAICFEPPPVGEVLVVDHNHESGEVRGLLCHNCNRGIGGLKESTVNLLSAVAYLMRRASDYSWDQRYLAMATFVAGWSKDTSTRVGAVLVGPTNEVISLGFNGFPRGVNDDVPERWQRPVKYSFCEHSERNSVFNAARHGARTMASTLYISSYPARLGPCDDCARAIIQSGISRVVYKTPAGEAVARWEESCKVGKIMLEEAGVTIDCVVG